MAMPSKPLLINRPGSGSGLGSNILSLAILTLIAKRHEYDVSVDWTERSLLKSKSANLFDVLFDISESELNATISSSTNKILSGLLVDNPTSLLEALINRERVVIVSKCAGTAWLQPLGINENLLRAGFFIPLLSCFKHRIYSPNYQISLHIRHGKGEFLADSAYFSRCTFLALFFPRILRFLIDIHLKSLSSEKKAKDDRVLTSDSSTIEDIFNKAGWSTVPKKAVKAEWHQKIPKSPTSTIEGLEYQEALNDISTLSKADIILHNGSALSYCAYLFSNSKTQFISLRELSLIIATTDKIFYVLLKIHSFLRQMSTRTKISKVR